MTRFSRRPRLAFQPTVEGLSSRVTPTSFAPLSTMPLDPGTLLPPSDPDTYNALMYTGEPVTVAPANISSVGGITLCE